MRAQESNPDEAGLTPEQLEERVREKAALKEAKAKIAADKLAAKEAKKKMRCARPLPLRPRALLIDTQPALAVAALQAAAHTRS